MDPPPPSDPASSQQWPQSLPDSGLQSIFDAEIPGGWALDDPTADWSALNDFYFCSSEPTNLDWPQRAGLESNPNLTSPSGENNAGQQAPDVSSATAHVTDAGDSISELQLRDIVNVSQWLDGAYRPAVPCSHCRKHRLQCLIIRTTAANPNPVTSCSSCVALFRECSLAKGEKRVAAGFETYTPVLGHLHGLPEHTEDQVRSKNMFIQDPRLTEMTRMEIRTSIRIMERNEKNPSNSSERELEFYENGFISTRNILIPTRRRKLDSLVKQGFLKSDCPRGLRMPVDGRSRKSNLPVSRLLAMPGVARP